MDKKVHELERQVVNQKEQLGRYEKRIHDVVTAYKGLLKEKEALEASLSAVSAPKDVAEATPSNEKASDAMSLDVAANPSVSASKDQIATVMNSLATLSAEKSRMEMSFQRDKKLLRQEMQEKEHRIRELEEKVKQNVNRNSMELEGLKSKLIVERHARERETNDQLVMVKELQKLLSDERQLKESLEMQLNSLKVAFAGQTQGTSQGKLDDLQSEIAQLKRDQLDLEQNHQSSGATGVTQKQLQELVANMKVQHTNALKLEQGRTMKAEEEIRNMSLSHEERVANLEARLAELSTTVGNYDRVRQQDQESIQRLKEKLLDAATSTDSRKKEGVEGRSFEEILEEIEQLKQLLLRENALMTHPVDVSRIFSLSNDHGDCAKEQAALRSELSKYKAECAALEEEGRTQKQHICNLQEKITVLNKNIEDQEVELKQSSDQHHRELAAEQEKWRQSLELAVRTKSDEMEQHLQKQRERSLNLLEEKDNEIKALKISVDLFLPTEATSEAMGSGSQHSATSPFSADSKTSNILHYVHELARKDVEISSLRKSKHSAESAMRQAIKDKITSQEELHDQIANLEEQVGR